MSTAEENKAVVRRFNEEVYNRGNLDAADELLAPTFPDHDFRTGEQVGIEDYKHAISELRAASSDLRFSIEEQIAEGDKVVTRSIGRGTHKQGEDHLGFAPTGDHIAIENIVINPVVEGKIVEERAVSDISPLWQRRLENVTLARERVEQELQVRGASNMPCSRRPFPPSLAGRSRPTTSRPGRWAATSTTLSL